MKRWIWVGLTVLFGFLGTGNAMFMRPQALPLDRLVENTKTYIKAHPESAEGYYTLGRIYYLGFVNKMTVVPGFGHAGAVEGLPNIAPEWQAGGMTYELITQEAQKRVLKEMELEKQPDYSSEQWKTYQERLQSITQELRDEKWTPEAISSEIVLQYAVDARTNLLKAIELDKGNALYQLGLVSLEEQVLDYLTEKKLKSKAFAAVNKESLLADYWKAFELSYKKDAELRYRPVSGLASLVSFEAGKAWVRLGGKDEEKLPVVTTHLEKMENLQMGAITPLVITDSNCVAPGDFTVSSTVLFDLDGEGTVERWSWITPETGMLVWDPQQRGVITSGTQLFGNYTFQIIWNDGFRALSALDDNADGQVAGRELNGLSVWYDRNSNGVSDAGEVVPLQELGVAALVCTAPELFDGMLLSASGVLYNNGDCGHLWDWISYTTGASE